MKLTGKKEKTCSCTGECTGYATRSDCPPLIVIAVALAAKESAAALHEITRFRNPLGH